MTEKIKIGISGCLLGQNIRFDGQHKYHWYINNILSEYFEYQSVCPEVAIGMGIPRKSVRLIGDVNDPIMIEPTSGTDWTQKMNQYSIKQASSFAKISGFIFKKGSPSCGIFRTKVYQKNGIPLTSGRGLFAQAITDRWPLLPVEDEGRLNDSVLRENFIEKVFGYHRLQTLQLKPFRKKDWIQFHQNHKFLLLSHSRKYYSILGQLIADISSYSKQDFIDQYSNNYMHALGLKTTRKKHTDVLMHILGFLKKTLNTQQKQNILQIISRYKNGEIPLIVPVTIIKHYVEVFQISYIQDQVYLNPHPDNLGLRNHI